MGEILFQFVNKFFCGFGGVNIIIHYCLWLIKKNYISIILSVIQLSVFLLTGNFRFGIM